MNTKYQFSVLRTVVSSVSLFVYMVSTTGMTFVYVRRHMKLFTVHSWFMNIDRQDPCRRYV